MRIAIFGAGLMGHALAVVYALGGHTVRITDRNPETLKQAAGHMNSVLETLREADEIDVSWTSERLASAVTACITPDETLEDAELIVEAIVENPDAKAALFAEIDRRAPPDAILASNTSRLDIFPLVPARRRARALAMHWYTPPYIVDLCDIVGSDETEPAVIETMRSMVVAMGKVPVVMKRFLPGYIANRIQGAISLEVNRLLDEGYATPRDIDDAIIHGLALRMPILGHLAKADFAGIPLAQAALANGTYQPPPPTRSSTTLDRLVKEGRTGVVSGHGYFDWGSRSAEELFRERDRKLLALKAALRAIGPMHGD